MNKKLIFVVLLVCLLALVAVMAFAQNSPNVRWEYTTLVFRSATESDRDGFIQKVNQLGADGWELILKENYSYIFKRRLP